MSYQPKTGARCTCKPGVHRDNCPNCEGTGWAIDFRAIRERREGVGVVKRATIRDPSVPRGQAAPLHVVCCGNRVPVSDGNLSRCPTCRTLYDGRGWIHQED